MRPIPFLLGLTLVAGCAAQPAPEPATVLASTSKPAATTLEEAQKLGYKVVDENGRQLYCREQPKLGSHLLKERVCLTEEELLAAREASQRNFQNMKKAAPLPKGN